MLGRSLPIYVKPTRNQDISAALVVRRAEVQGFGPRWSNPRVKGSMIHRWIKRYTQYGSWHQDIDVVWCCSIVVICCNIFACLYSVYPHTSRSVSLLHNVLAFGYNGPYQCCVIYMKYNPNQKGPRTSTDQPRGKVLLRPLDLKSSINSLNFPRNDSQLGQNWITQTKWMNIFLPYSAIWTCFLSVSYMLPSHWKKKKKHIRTNPQVWYIHSLCK